MTPAKPRARTKRPARSYAVESFGDEFPDLVADRTDLDDTITLMLRREDMERVRVFVDYYPSSKRGYVWARRIVGEIDKALRGDRGKR